MYFFRRNVAYGDSGAKLIEKVIKNQTQGKPSSTLVDAIIDNHVSLKAISPGAMKQWFIEAGLEVKALGNKSHTIPGKPFEKGGGYRVHFGGDGIVRYHPEGGYY